MTEKPNILFITTDQQRADTVFPCDDPWVWTPHLNWLRDNGISYRNAYSDCPVCMPARISIMGGQPAWRHGVTSNRYIPSALDPDNTLPARLGGEGYQTRLIGKHHHGATTRHLMGFQSQETIEHYERWTTLRGLPHHLRHGVGGNENVPAAAITHPTQTLDAWITDRAIDFIEMRDPTRPFFAWLSYLKPHPPWDVSTAVREMYHEAPMPAPARGEWSDRTVAAPAWHAVTDELSMTGRLAPWQMTAARRAYAAAVTEVDLQLGSLFGALGELGLLDSTWIIFTSDHGEMLGDHGMGGKCVPFEASARIPVIVRPPFSPRNHTEEPRRGTNVDDLVSLTDVSRTILHLAGAREDNLDAEGAVLPGLLEARSQTGDKRAAPSPRVRIVGTCMYMHYIVRDGWKYCRETLTGQELLFHVSGDPGERKNRANVGAEARTLRAFRHEMDEHLSLVEALRAEQRVHDYGVDPGVLSPGQTPPQNVHPGFRSGRYGLGASH